MIAGSFGSYTAKTARDHAFRTESVSDGETNGGAAPQTARWPGRLWQTDGVTFGRIIIGWRVGT